MSPSFGPTVLSQDPHFLLRDRPTSSLPFHPHRCLAQEHDLLPLPQLANPTSCRATSSVTAFILDLDISIFPGPSPQSSKCSFGGSGPPACRASFLYSGQDRMAGLGREVGETLHPSQREPLLPSAPSSPCDGRSSSHASKASPRLTESVFSSVSLRDPKSTSCTILPHPL